MFECVYKEESDSRAIVLDVCAMVGGRQCYQSVSFSSLALALHQKFCVTQALCSICAPNIRFSDRAKLQSGVHDLTDRTIISLHNRPEDQHLA